MNTKALSIMRYQDDINTEHNMPRGSGSVDKPPDSQWIYAGSKLERRKHSLITRACHSNKHTNALFRNE